MSSFSLLGTVCVAADAGPRRAWIAGVYTVTNYFFFFFCSSARHFFSKRMKSISSFSSFASARMQSLPTIEETVDTCLQAVHDGVLDVCVQSCDGGYLWNYFWFVEYVWTYARWQRVCGLLQRAGVANSILWDSKCLMNSQHWAGIEYLWTDLDAVHRVLERGKPRWLVQELGRRQAWAAGLRRAWLSACCAE
jgi:hypothetical protein